MKYVLLTFLLTPVFLFAQSDGSVGTLPDPKPLESLVSTSSSTSVPAGTATPRSEAVTPPRPVLITHPPSPEPPPIVIDNQPPEESSNSMALPIVGGTLLLGALAFLGFKLSAKNNSKKDKNDKSRCFNIKDLMDKKLEELTDLKGQLEDKAKEAGREKIRETLANTAEGKLLALIESGEKEYNRLKELFDQCMIDFGTKKHVIIVHGCPSDEEKSMNPDTRTYDKHWMPWLKKELIAKTVQTDTPSMPSPWAPDYEKYKQEFEKYKIDEDTTLIGHSCGGAFLVRWLGETKKKISKLILVAPWKIPDNDEFRKAFYEYPIDESIKERVKNIVMFTADNEEDDGKKSLEIFHKALGGKIVELKGRGHYTFGDMKTEEFPELLEEILS